jgi:protein-disulfide isomerase
VNGESATGSDIGSGDLTVPVTTRDHIQGPDTAPVTLVEYADYECPYSARAYPAVKALQRELGDQLRFVYRNYPLRDIHPHAQHAAEAAEAAAHQGRFWAMHDVLFEHRRALEDEHLREYAEELGLDMDRFEQDMAEHRFAARIEEDIQGGAASGVPGTPTFFINGVRYEGKTDPESLLSTIGEAAAP